MMALAVLLLFLSVFLTCTAAQCPIGVSVCDKIYRNECSSDACIQRTRELANDESRFWFGNDYDITCSGADASDRTSRPECYNPEAKMGGSSSKRSIAERLFGAGQLDAARFDRFIEMKFYSEAANYTACGGQFERRFRAFDVHPEMDPVEPWYIRSAPEQLYITPREPNAYYTVLFIDAGYGTLHGLFVDLNDELRTLLPWQPPLAIANHTNPIVAVVYKQPSKGYFVEPRWLMTMKSDRLVRQMFDLNDFVADHNLVGPVALNWIPIVGDAYSAEQLRSRGTADSCLAFVKQRVLQSQSTTTTTGAHRSNFLTADSLSQLDAYLNIRFVVPPSSFSVCCQNYRFAQNTFNVNALSSVPTDAINVRIKPAAIVVRPQTSSSVNNTTFANKFYTLIAVNPDVVNNAVATPFQPMTAYMLINAPGNAGNDGINFNQAQEILAWERPVPAPKSPGERVWFLLYEQPGKFERFSTQANISQYADPSCGYELKDRCLFRVNDMQRDLRLALRAITWFDVVSDPFARYVLIKSGQAEWNVCAFVPGYSRPCPSQIQLNKDVLNSENEIAQVNRDKARGDDLDRLTAAQQSIGREQRSDATRAPAVVGGLWSKVVFAVVVVGVYVSRWLSFDSY